MSVEQDLVGVQGEDSVKQELRLWLKMLSVTKSITQEIRRRLRAEFGATLPQFDLLAQLYREPDGLRLGELSKTMMVTNGNVTGLVERLENDGLVIRRTPGEDRRVTVALLSDEGRSLFARMAEAHEGWMRDMMADVDQKTIATMLAHMDVLRQSARAHCKGFD